MSELYYYFAQAEFSTGPVFDLIGSNVSDLKQELKTRYPECQVCAVGIHHGVPGFIAAFSVPYLKEWLDDFRYDLQEVTNDLLAQEGWVRFVGSFIFDEELGLGTEKPGLGKRLFFYSTVQDFHDYYERGLDVPAEFGDVEPDVYLVSDDPLRVTYEFILPSGVDYHGLKVLPRSWITDVKVPPQPSRVVNVTPATN